MGINNTTMSYGNRFKALPQDIKNKVMWCRLCESKFSTSIDMVTDISFNVECKMCDTNWKVKFQDIKGDENESK